MAQNITIANATYSAVPAIDVPKQGGGTARYSDASVTTATASDVKQGKVFVNAQGERDAGTYVPTTPTGNINITQAGVTDVTNYATATAAAAQLVGYIVPQNDDFTLEISEGGEVLATYADYEIFNIVSSAGFVDGNATIATQIYHNDAFQLPTQAATTITPTTSAQTAVAKGKWTTGAVTVAAMPSGSATPAASISGTAATVSTGTNTLTLSKTVSNTPQVSAGYVSSGTAGNSSVSLTANVTTKAATTYHPSSSQQTIASDTYLTGTQTINAVTTTNLTADNIKNGVVVQVGDSSDPDSVTSVTGTYDGGGGSSKNVQAYFGRAQRTANSYGATTLTITVAKTGTYNVYWTAWRGSSSGTMGTNLHRNNSSGTNQQTWTGTYGQNITLTNQSYTQGDVLTLYATSGSNSRSIYVANLIIEEQ